MDVVGRGGEEVDLGDLGGACEGLEGDGGDLEAVAVGAVEAGAGALRAGVANGAVEVDDGGVEGLLGVVADVVAKVGRDEEVGRPERDRVLRVRTVRRRLNDAD